MMFCKLSAPGKGGDDALLRARRGRGGPQGGVRRGPGRPRIIVVIIIIISSSSSTIITIINVMCIRDYCCLCLFVLHL